MDPALPFDRLRFGGHLFQTAAGLGAAVYVLQPCDERDLGAFAKSRPCHYRGSGRSGCQLAFVNRAEKSALQLGLLCFNKSGFLPFFVFFNFDPKMFGSGN